MWKQNTMNFLKKHYTKLILLIAVVSFIISLTIIIIKRNNREIVLVNYLQNYIINDKNYEISLELFSSEKSVEYFDQELITDTYLTDNNSLTNYCQLKLSSITYEKLDTNNYHYKIKFDFPMLGSDVSYFENVVLNIESNEDKLEIPIGNVIYLPNSETNFINVSRIKGIVNKINDMEMLSGVVVEFGKNDKVKITNIDLSLPYGNVSTANILEVEYDNISNNTELSTIIPNYNILNEEKNNLSLLLDKESNTYLIPFSYKKLFFTNQTAIIIEFEYLGSLYKEIIPPYCYFNSTNNYYEEYRQSL